MKWGWTLPLLLVWLLAGCERSATMQTFNIVPEPVFLVQKEGSFTLSGNPTLCFVGMGQNSPTARYIMKSLRHAHLRPSLVAISENTDIALILNDTVNPEIGEEGYLIEVRSSGIRMSANTEVGLFYAYQTLVQMLPADVSQTPYRSVTLPECTILDYPRFGWRGSHLDVSRHFFPMKYIKRHIDLMAMYKMNKLHLHLTDDQGWRMPSDRYPRLNSIGSWRVDREGVPWGEAHPAQEGERTTYGGYYSKEDVVEMVEYAAARGIEVIPEIDLPAHCAALLAAYPQFGCGDETFQVAIGPSTPSKATLCAGNDSVLLMLYDLLDEVVAFFPSQYVHIGGNETDVDRWKSCSRCQHRIYSEHLHSERELQGWLLHKVEEYLKEHGRVAVCWDEVATEGVSHEAVVMAQSGMQQGMVAAREGNRVVMCPKDYCNLDYYQADARYQSPATEGMVTLARAYEFDPAPIGTNSHIVSNILGGQCNLWTEYIGSASHAEYMLLPRMLAISEGLWSQSEKKDWNRFRRKVEGQKDRLSAKGYNYCEGSFSPKFEVRRVSDSVMNISISTEVPNTYIFYTTDLSTPTRRSPIYIGPINLERGTHIKILPVYNDIERDSVYEFIIK